MRKNIYISAPPSTFGGVLGPTSSPKTNSFPGETNTFVFRLYRIGTRSPKSLFIGNAPTHPVAASCTFYNVKPTLLL